MILFSSLYEVVSMNSDVNFRYNYLLNIYKLKKISSHYTIENYKHDLKEFFIFMSEQKITDVAYVEYLDARIFLTQLYERNLSKRTVARKISCLRTFYKFLSRREEV